MLHQHLKEQKCRDVATPGGNTHANWTLTGDATAGDATAGECLVHMVTPVGNTPAKCAAPVLRLFKMGCHTQPKQFFIFFQYYNSGIQ